MLHNGATVADIILNLSHSAIATTINIADLVNQITEIPAPTEDEEEEPQKDYVEKLKSK